MQASEDVLRTASRNTCVVQLDDVRRADAPRVGAKAANLGGLRLAGFHVPDGFVITAEAFDRFLAANGLGPDSSPESVEAAPMPADLAESVQAAAERLGDTPLAVRSSSLAEDLADASFAGQYETVLDVRGKDALLAAIQRCWASALGDRAATYRAVHEPGLWGMAVIVQRLVAAEKAGVAFTANPLTGDRGVTLVSAVRGLGDRLVSGLATPDEWDVRGAEAVCRRPAEGAISADDAQAIAHIARRVEEHFGGIPQDVEWALAAGELFLLQARPITALAEPVEWKAPAPGGWARNFRLGEWLGDPVTPLFATWLLPRLDERFWEQNKRLIGPPPRPEPPYAIVNGWFFASMNAWTAGFLGTLWWLVRSPRSLRLAALMSPRTARRAAGPFIAEWRDVERPRYRALVKAGEAVVDSFDAAALIRLIEELATAAGDYSIWLALIGGTGWKSEIPLARFYRERLQSRVGGSHQRLLAGLVRPVTRPHAAYSLDWYHPTLGETAPDSADPEAADRWARLQAQRRAAEDEARAALADEPRHLREFEQLLETAQHFVALREEVVGDFTLGWPLMRRALLRIGAYLRAKRTLRADEDIFFLTHDELLGAVSAGLPAGVERLVVERRETWRRQRRLTPPLTLGTMLPMVAKSFLALGDVARSRDVSREPGLHGLPASPGRAMGPARIIRTPDEFARLAPGDVLVAPATTPAWTPLFARAGAVVTDTGSVLAHASLVAREYGIPAVVGVGDGTARLRDGQMITVDGSAGTIEMAPE